MAWSEKAIDHGALMLCERDNPAGAACEPRCEMCKLMAKQVLDAAAAVDGDAQSDLTWFWEIVDRGGLNNVCSDERGALAELVRYAAERDSLRAKLEKAREALEVNMWWVRGALDCKTWSWDADQREAAEHCYKKGTAILSELSADAPAQPPVNYNPAGLALVREKLGRISSNFSDDPRSDADVALESLDKFCERATATQISKVAVQRAIEAFFPSYFPKSLTEPWQDNMRAAIAAALNTPATQISDGVRALLDEAIAALEPFEKESAKQDLYKADNSDGVMIKVGLLRQASAVIAKLRAARNG